MSHSPNPRTHPRSRGRKAWVLAPLMGLLAACSGGGGGGGSGGVGTPPAFGLEGPLAISGLAFDFGAAQPGAISVISPYPSVGASAIELQPLPDGSGRMVSIDKSGFGVTFLDSPSAGQADSFFDLSNQIQQGGEAGLLGLCFDPGYAQNGRLYVFYSAQGSNRSVLARLTTINGFVNLGSLTELLSIQKVNNFHNGGKLAFGPDGYLYAAVGDDGNPDNAQDLSNLHGKLLRLQANGSPAPGNPFANTPGARPEIWAYGLRNPWRFSFDAMNGELWAADVGELSREEIDLILPGRNYGWPMFEGSQEYDNGAGIPYSETEPPVFEYDHSEGQAIIGGFVYRGNQLPSLTGAYLYADAVVGRLWALTRDLAGNVTNTLLATGLPFPVTLGQDSQGEPRIGCLVGAQILGLEEQNGSIGQPVIPEFLSQTGVFADLTNLNPVSGFVPYEPNAPFWSDGAEKRRWIGLPAGTSIGFSATSNWTFPVGTVVVKHFDLETAAGPRHLETRVLYRTAAAWDAYTYRWNNEQTDAQLVEQPQLAFYAVPDPQNASLTIQKPWLYLGPAQCFQCHTAASGYALGLSTRQLNGEFDYELATDNQLRAWNHIGWFASDIGAPSQYGALANPYDPASGSLDERARSYLQTNCANCHQPAGPTALDMDLRFGIPVSQMKTHGIAPQASDLGIVGAQRIDPFSKNTSIVYQRMLRLDQLRMPPVGTYSLDIEGVQLIGAWIDQGAQ